MAAVILFNNVAMEAIAPVMVEDIRVSPISLNVTARQRPLNAGADFVRVVGGTRTVSITFAIITQESTARQMQLQALTEWARSEQPGRLELPYHSGVHLLALATSLPEPSTRQWWENKLRLVFTCYDPYWRSNDERSCACGTAFTALGDAPPLVQIRDTLAADASNVAFSDGTDTMTFSAIPAGDMVIDLNAQTAAVDDSSIMSAYVFGSHFLRPKTGNQTITGTGTVYWRERWE